MYSDGACSLVLKVADLWRVSIDTGWELASDLWLVSIDTGWELQSDECGFGHVAGFDRSGLVGRGPVASHSCQQLWLQMQCAVCGFEQAHWQQ